MKQIYFITTNDLKFVELQGVFEGSGIEVLQERLETPEIQSMSVAEIAGFSASWAAQKLQKPVIVEDRGVYFEALNGFPGPFIKYVEKAIHEDGLLRVMEGQVNRNAYWEFAVAYCDPGASPKSFTTKYQGSITSQKLGISSYTMDKIFVPLGETLTVSQIFDNGGVIAITDHYIELKNYLQSLA